MSAIRSRVLPLLALPSILAADALRAQLPDWVPEGARLRVTRDTREDSEVTGTLAAGDSVNLSILREADGQLVVVPLAGLRRVRVSRERSHASGRTALLTGAVLGGLGVLLGSQAKNDKDASMILNGCLLFPLGAGLGALIGLGATSDVWMEVPLAGSRAAAPRVEPIVGSVGSSIGLGGRITW